MHAQRKYVLLALSQDRGSYQSILPVIMALRQMPDFAIHSVAPAVSKPLLDQYGVVCSAFDEQSFLSAPAPSVGNLIDQHRPDLIISGSSPAKGALPETPEQFAILEARRRNVPTLSVLDFWGMYAERFTSRSARVDLSLVPDHLCVLDRRNFDDLRALGVPAHCMSITHNPWLDEVARMAEMVPAASPCLNVSGLRVLFVSQPIAETAHARNWTTTQHTLLRDLVNALPAGDPAIRHRVLIWIHPAENRARWEQIDRSQRKDVDIMITDERGPAILAHVDWVVNRHSTVPYEAAYHGTPCISLLWDPATSTCSIMDELGLSVPIRDKRDLATLLSTADPVQLRARNLARKRELMTQKHFFSDGRATERVVNKICSILPR